MSEKKKVLITGGTNGIGYAIAMGYVAQGDTVVITGRNQDKIKEICDSSDSENLFGMQWDAADVDSHDANVRKAASMMGGLDILINNAGVIDVFSSFENYFKVTPYAWDKIINTNLKGTYFMCQACARYMIENDNRHGYIINIGSEMGVRSKIPMPYNISKWGVTALTQGLGKMLAPYGITVNGIAPGDVATDMQKYKPGDSLKRSHIPRGVMSRPEEIADMVISLTSGRFDSVVGQMIVADGGSSLW